MKKISNSFLWAIVLSLMMIGTASAIDIPSLSTWTQPMGVGGDMPGTGDLLLAPLYDVRELKNPYTTEGTTLKATQNTLISIVNMDDVYGVIVRLRFREWKRGIEVLSIDIPISCDGAWVGMVSRLNGGGAVITSPVPPAGSSANRWINPTSTPTSASFPSAPFPTDGIQFLSGNIESSETDKKARTEYGYFEIIGEEKVKCKADTTGNWIRLGAGISRDVDDTLMGTAYLVRPEAAISHQYRMNAYSRFSIDPAGIWQSPGTGRPDLKNDVQGQAGNPGMGGFDQFEAIMSKRNVIFDYVNSPGMTPPNDTTPMSTSVVVTFPTKHFHYSQTPPFKNVGGAGTGNWAPFAGVYMTRNDGPSGGEFIVPFIFDRNGNKLERGSDSCTVIEGVECLTLRWLSWEVNVIGLLPLDPLPWPESRGFRDNVLIETKFVATLGQSFTSGWGRIDLSPDSYFGGYPYDTRSAAIGGAGFTQGKSGVTFNFLGTLFPTGAGPVPGVNFPVTLAGAPVCGTGGCPGAYRGLSAIGVVMTEFFNGSLNGYYGNTVPWQSDVDFGSVPLAIP